MLRTLAILAIVGFSLTVGAEDVPSNFSNNPSTSQPTSEVRFLMERVDPETKTTSVVQVPGLTENRVESLVSDINSENPEVSERAQQDLDELFTSANTTANTVATPSDAVADLSVPNREFSGGNGARAGYRRVYYAPLPYIHHGGIRYNHNHRWDVNFAPYAFQRPLYWGPRPYYYTDYYYPAPIVYRTRPWWHIRFNYRFFGC